MTTRRKLLKEIAKHGGEVDWDVSYLSRGTKHICIDAPEGHEWVDNGCNVIVEHWYDGPASEFYSEVFRRVEHGVCAL